MGGVSVLHLSCTHLGVYELDHINHCFDCYMFPIYILQILIITEGGRYLSTNPISAHVGKRILYDFDGLTFVYCVGVMHCVSEILNSLTICVYRIAGYQIQRIRLNSIWEQRIEFISRNLQYRKCSDIITQHLILDIYLR